MRKVSTSKLNPTDSRRILILLQIHQHLAESLLARAARAAAAALARDVNQLGDALPAGAAGGGIFPVGEELLGVGAGLRAQLVGLVVVRDVEIVDVLVGLLDRRFLLLLGELDTAGDVGVASRAPFPGAISSPSGAGRGCRSLLHRFGLLLGLLVAGVAGRRERRTGAGDGAAGGNLLWFVCISNCHIVEGIVTSIVPRSVCRWPGTTTRTRRPPQPRGWRPPLRPVGCHCRPSHRQRGLGT